MKSTYAPLPFSYLSANANPKVGLRKEGVYGTSGDVQAIYSNTEGRAMDPGSDERYPVNPYGIYSNGNDIKPNPDPTYDGIYKTAPLPRLAVENGRVVESKDPVYDTRPRPDPNLNGVRDPFAMRSIEPERPKTPTPYQSRPTGRQAYELTSDPDSINSKDPGPKPTELTPKEFDNFILVKDKNRPDSPPPAAAAAANLPANNPSRNQLHKLFDADEPTKKQLPRYNMSSQNTPSSSFNRINNPKPVSKQETGFDGPNYSLYYGAPTLEGGGGGRQQQQQPPASSSSFDDARLREDRPKTTDTQHDSFRNSDSRLVKDSGGKNGCCVCRRCTCVIIAIIITAIIALGAGFIAGWFGGMAAHDNSANTQTPQKASNFSSTSSGSFASTTTSTYSSSLTTTTTTATTSTSTTTKPAGANSESSTSSSISSSTATKSTSKTTT